MGRFISRDPLGYVDGMGLYNGYFAEVFGVDPSGECLNRGYFIILGLLEKARRLKKAYDAIRRAKKAVAALKKANKVKKAAEKVKKAKEKAEKVKKKLRTQ